MTSGGYESGPDYVAAKVSVDIPTESLTTLTELSQLFERNRVAAEAGARMNADYGQSIRGIQQAAVAATEAQQSLAAALERTFDAQSRGIGGGQGTSGQLTMNRLVPEGAPDPFAGMGAGQGMGGSRAVAPGDVSSQIQQGRINNPEMYLNAQAGANNIRPGDLSGGASPADMRGHADRISARDQQLSQQADQASPDPNGVAGGGSRGRGFAHYAGLAGSLMNGMAVGGSHAGMLGAIQKTLGASGHGAAADAEGSLLSGLAGKFGKIAGPIGLGLAGLGLTEKGGAIYQGYKNMGSIQGGGAGEGFGDEMAIRSLALNPFISNEQARQVIMAGLTEGYHGKSFDTITQFMTENLKEMNLSVSDQVQLLRKNVNEGGQSLVGLGASLAMLKGIAGKGAMSLPDLQQAFTQASGQMADMGMNMGNASQDIATMLGGWDDQQSKGTFLQAGMGLLGNTGGQLMLAREAGAPGGLMPDSIPEWLSENPGSVSQATDKVLKNFFNQIFRSPQTRQKGSSAYLNAVSVLHRRLGMYGIQWNRAQTQAAVDKLIAGEDPNQQGTQVKNEITQQENAPAGFLQSSLRGLGGFVGSGVDALEGAVGWAWKSATEGSEAADAYWDQKNSQAEKEWYNSTYQSNGSYTNPILNNVVDQIGANNIEVGSGNSWSKLDGSQEQLHQLTQGKANWRRVGDHGGGTALADTPQAGSVGNGGKQDLNVAFQPAEVNIRVSSDGTATADQSTVRLTPIQQQALGGQNGAQMNNRNGYDRGADIY